YALIMLDPKGHVISWNIGAERVSGFTGDEVLGKHLSMFFSSESVQQGEVRRRLEGAVKHGSYTAEGWLTRKDGNRIRVQTNYSCLYDDLGSPTGFAMLTRDITERWRMQERMRADMVRLSLVAEAGGMGTFEEDLTTRQVILSLLCADLLGLPEQLASSAD